MTDTSPVSPTPENPVGGGRPLPDRLPCGHRTDDLLEQVADGHADRLDDHQRGCVHCQAALRELGALWAPVREFAATPVSPPPSMIRQAMDQVHRLADNTWYTMELTESGTVRVAARVVAALAREAARAVPGVNAALGRTVRGRVVGLVEKATRSHRHPNSAVGVLGRTAAVDLAIDVIYGENVHETAAHVQRRVGQHLRDVVGLQQVVVNVTVDDVHIEPDDPPTRRR